MPTCEWVLDTWLLEIAQDPLDPRSLDALALLHEIKASHRIAVDYGHQILSEYFRHVKGDSHAGQWLNVTVNKAEKIGWRAGKSRLGIGRNY